MAEDNGVVVKSQHSYIMDHTYEANAYHHCGAFIGQHYLFKDYFVAAERGDYEFKILEI